MLHLHNILQINILMANFFLHSQLLKIPRYGIYGTKSCEKFKASAIYLSSLGILPLPFVSSAIVNRNHQESFQPKCLYQISVCFWNILVQIFITCLTELLSVLKTTSVVSQIYFIHTIMISFLSVSQPNNSTQFCHLLFFSWQFILKSFHINIQKNFFVALQQLFFQ